MTELVPRIVTSLPGRTLRETSEQIRVAHAAGADLAEVRFDRWSTEERGRAAELFPSPLPLLATLRSRAEGGAGPDAVAERARELERLAALPFDGIDLEASRDRELLGRLPPSHPRWRVLSVHVGDGAAVADVARALREEAPAGTVRKVVVPASVHAALRELLPSLPPAGDGPRVLLTTGPSGPLLRAWSARLEFPLVFASLPAERRAVDGPPVEPSQVPTDRMRSFLDGGPNAPMFAIVGRPVAHSQSPYLHARWMRATGRHGLYVPLEIEDESEFVESLPALAEGGFRGVNVTHPWKAAAIAAADRVGRAAELCGAANCLTFAEGGTEADNTDLAAVLRRLEEYRAQGVWSGRELIVVGAGGAAAASVVAARDLGAHAFVTARDRTRGRALADRLGASWLGPEEYRPFDLAIHATPVGRADAGDLELPLGALLARGSRLLDWVYAPDRSLVRDAAEATDARYEDGWRLLVYQAAASFGIWWDAEPSGSELDATIEEGPCAG